VDRRRLILSGIGWNAAFQVFHTALTFGTMLFLVRIIPPVEYGRVGALLGVLMALNAFGCGAFMAHALQLPDGEEPDWSAHFGAGLYVQVGLCVLANLVAGLFWFLPQYRPIAPLLHLGAFGLLFDWPSQLRIVMLRRALDFRRYRIVLACAALGSVGTQLALGLAGFGAVAIVLGANVITAIPFGVDLLLVHRFRPRPGWWRWPGRAYAASLKFGLQQATASLLQSSRGLLATAVLPPTLGLAAMGLLNRAQGLLLSTVGRVQSVLVETVYPLLPRYASDEEKFRDRASMFVRVMLWGVAPAIIFFGFQGPAVSRLLYGAKWIEADPLLWPAAVAALAALLGSVAMAVLLAKSRLRECVIVDVTGFALATGSMAWPLFGGGLTSYAWIAAAAQLLTSLVALLLASPLLARGWSWHSFAAPLGASAVAGLATLSLQPIVNTWPGWARLCALSLVYGTVVGVILRIGFPRAMGDLLAGAPGGARVARWIRLAPQEPQ
jgi:O-antigen/teichoic acid export membrane protein